MKSIPQAEIKEKPKSNNGWYKVKDILGHRIVKEKMMDKCEFEVQWEGYAEPSWESFCGFVKDTPVKVEKYLVRSQIKPYESLKRQMNRLLATHR